MDVGRLGSVASNLNVITEPCRENRYNPPFAACMMLTVLPAISSPDPAHRTREERRSFGRSLRTRIKRIDQGDWSPTQRTFDVVDLLREANRSRIARLLPIKWA